MVFIPGAFLPEYRVARKFPITSTDGWWLNRWPMLGWLETIIKLAAFVAAAYVPLRNPTVIPPPRSYVGRASFSCETFLMFGAAVLLSLAIFDRLCLYREVISMIFVFPNMWAHWNVVIAMYRLGRSGISVRHFRIFCFLMLAGDVVKLIFFAVHDFSMLNIARYVSSLSLSPLARLELLFAQHANTFSLSISTDCSDTLLARLLFLHPLHPCARSRLRLPICVGDRGGFNCFHVPTVYGQVKTELRGCCRFANEAALCALESPVV
jgi:hypothetical protein